MEYPEPTPPANDRISGKLELFIPLTIFLGFLAVLAAVFSHSAMGLLLLPLGLVIYFLIFGLPTKKSCETSFRADDTALLILENDVPERIIPYREVTAVRTRRSARGKLRYVAARLEGKDHWTVVSTKPDELPLGALRKNKPDIAFTEVRESGTLNVLSGAFITAGFFCMILSWCKGKTDGRAEHILHGSFYGLCGVGMLIEMLQCGAENRADPNKRSYSNGAWLPFLWITAGLLRVWA